MSGEISSKTSLVPSRFDVAVFDLDGVVTDTARVHFQAWKETFDTFFEMRGRHEGSGFAPFTTDDYRRCVDGRPREDAIRAVLAARGAELPEGSACDGPEVESVHGLAKCKDELFLEHIRSKGVDVYPSTVALIRRLRGLPNVGVASKLCLEPVHLTFCLRDGRVLRPPVLGSSSP